MKIVKQKSEMIDAIHIRNAFFSPLNSTFPSIEWESKDNVSMIKERESMTLGT